MPESAIAAETAEALAVDREVFQRQVEADAAIIESEIESGTFDNPQGIVGFEYEFYAVADGERAARWTATDDPVEGSLVRVSRRLLTHIGFERELGLHNAEMSTSPQPINPHGLAAQESEVRARLSAALSAIRAEDMRLVSDAVWTIPPAGETTRGYLTDSVVDDGIRVATNMSDVPRYHAMANADRAAGMRIDVPHVTLQADTVMPESLVTSIQPHYQVPHAADLPAYFTYAVRIAGPLLALGVNSPLLPPDLYDEGVSPATILADAWDEHRIRIFETAMNTDGIRKVRFPRDLDRVEEAVDRIANDDTLVPLTVDRGDRFDDRFAHFRLKHGTYWRWVRPVFAGATESSAHARIEFRPIPGQPTVRDSIAFQAAFAGLLERMHAHSHPVRDLDWEAARENFYAAMRDGFGADLRWITAEGEPTTDAATIYDDLLDTAAAGLRARGLDDDAISRYLGPLRSRARDGVTPARWKRDAVSRRLDDGDDLEGAIYGMQREYIRRQADTLIDGTFDEWPAGDRRR